MNSSEVIEQVASYFAPSSQAIAGILIRRLANGTPVSRSEAATLIGCDQSELETRLGQLSFRVEADDQNRIIGAGLTLRSTPHQFVIDGKHLCTWCAIDTLMFAVLLNRTAEVTSPCAVTRCPVSVTVFPEGILAARPPEAVVSVVAPPPNDNDVRQNFCVHVNFFESREAAQSWSGQRKNATILSLPDAFALARKMARSFDSAESCPKDGCCTR